MVHIKAAQRVQITYTLEAVVQLTCTIVHPNCQLCVHSFEKDTTVAQQPSWNLGYIDVSWLSVPWGLYTVALPFKCPRTGYNLGYPEMS